MTDINELETRGFVAIPYNPVLRGVVVRSIESWRQFCSLPDVVKQSFGYSNDSAGVGYERKGLKGPSQDQKENFDITDLGIEWLLRHHVMSGNSSPVAVRFVEDTINVLHSLHTTVWDFARSIGEAFGLKGIHPTYKGVTFGDEVGRRNGACFVRFIHYFGDVPPGIETAEAHTDQSGFTLHLYESNPGLQYLDSQKRWHDMPVSEGETVIIPSMQLQLRSEGRLKALVHRVISNEQTAREGRYSAVCFVQLAGPVYDKVNGRLQDLHKQNLGFNYGMSHGEFKGLFKG